MKRFWSILMATVLVLSLLSVAGLAQEAEQTLNIVGSVRTYPGQEEAWNELIAAFEAKYPNIKVNVRWQGTWEEIPTNMTSSMLSNEDVDIYTAGAGIINSTLASSGALLDMTEVMAPYLDRFNTGMLNAYYIGDRLWGFPYGDSGESCVYYNKTMFDELGLTPPTTYDELVTLSKAIADAKGITPMIHQGKVPGFWPMWFFETYAQTSGNKSVDNVREFLSGTKSFAGDPEVIAALEAVKKFYDDGILSTSSLDTDGDGVRAAFAAGKAAMFYGGTWEYSPLRAACDESIELGCFEFPSLDGVTTPQHGGGPSDAIVIPSWVNRDKLETISLFIDFMTAEENVNIVISTFVPIIEVFKGEIVEQNELSEVLNGPLRDNTIMFLDWIWPSAVNDAVCQAIPAVIDGAMTAEEGAALIQTALDNLVEEQGYSYDWYNNWTEDQWAAVAP